MKVTATKDFGTNRDKNKIVLPLIPEPTEIAKKEDLAQLDLYSNPADANSTKVRFAFKILEGANDAPREIIQWRRNVERAFTGLGQTVGVTQHQMLQQFLRGTALSTYNTHVATMYGAAKANDTKTAEDAVKADADAGAPNPAATALLAQAVVDAKAKTQDAYLTEPDDGAYMVEVSLNSLMTSLLPNKVLQRVKRYLRREARKPFDMNIKAYYMHIMRINAEEIPRLPPLYSTMQSLGDAIPQIALD